MKHYNMTSLRVVVSIKHSGDSTVSRCTKPGKVKQEKNREKVQDIIGLFGNAK